MRGSLKVKQSKERMNSQVSRRVSDTRRAERKREREALRRHELQCQQLRASAALDEQRRGILNEAANSKCASFGTSTAVASTWRCRVTTTTTTTHVAEKPFSLQNCGVAKKFTEQRSQNETGLEKSPQAWLKEICVRRSTRT